MAGIDLLLNEVAERFGIGGQAVTLLSGLLLLMNDTETGEFPGFLDRFKRAGLGEQANSWVSNGHNEPLTPKQLESALGSDAIERFADRVGLPSSVVSAALAFMTPNLIDYLTPGSVVPTSLPLGLSSYLHGASNAVPAKYAYAGSTLLKVLPVLVMALMGLFVYRYASSLPPLSQSMAQSMAMLLAPVPSINSTLSLSNLDGKIKFSGVVPDEKTKQAILAQLKKNSGPGNFSGNLTVDSSAKPVTWPGGIGVVLRDFNVTGAELSFDGDAIKVGGSIPDAAKTGLAEKIKSVFGETASIEAVKLDRSEEVQSAQQPAQITLTSLAPGFATQDLLKALNLEAIHFASGSALIPLESIELLKQSAEAIKRLPTGTALEVGGHTDQTGAALTNLKLSQLRAEAVRAYLIKLGVNPTALIAKGKGDNNPVASDDTEAGRLKNRRIEFNILQ